MNLTTSNVISNKTWAGGLDWGIRYMYNGKNEGWIGDAWPEFNTLLSGLLLTENKKTEL